jgi:hypothetical protein
MAGGRAEAVGQGERRSVHVCMSAANVTHANNAPRFSCCLRRSRQVSCRTPLSIFRFPDSTANPGTHVRPQEGQDFSPRPAQKESHSQPGVPWCVGAGPSGPVWVCSHPTRSHGPPSWRWSQSRSWRRACSTRTPPPACPVKLGRLGLKYRRAQDYAKSK